MSRAPPGGPAQDNQRVGLSICRHQVSGIVAAVTKMGVNKLLNVNVQCRQTKIIDQTGPQKR